MPNVYVINDSGHDYSPAEEFGKLVILSKGNIDKYHVTKMLRTFEPLLESSPDDFIIQAGPAVMCCVACAMFSTKHQCLNLLIYRLEAGGSQRYVARRLNFKGTLSCI